MKMISDNRRITIRVVADDVGISDDNWCIRHEMCSSEGGSHGHQESLTTFDDDPHLLKEIITGDESWVYSYGIETKAQSSQWKRPEEPILKKHFKFNQMWRYCLLFSSYAMTCCIRNFCHKVVRLVRNTTLRFAPRSNSSETHSIVEKPIMDFAPW